MKQKILQKIVLIALLLTSSHAFAYDFSKDGIYYNIISSEERTVEVTECPSGSVYQGGINLKNKVIYNGITYTVTRIGNSAFSFSNISKITLPQTLLEIGWNAFWRCSNLTTITIPQSVIKIYDNPFLECSNLNAIIVEGGNTMYDSRDNCNAIIHTSSSQLVTGCKKTIIPNNIKSFGYQSFYGCSGLTSVTIPETVNYIGAFAFGECNSLRKIDCHKSLPPNCGVWPPIEGSIPRNFSEYTLQYATLYVPKGSKKAYESVDPWRNFWNIEEKEFSVIESNFDIIKIKVLANNSNIVIEGVDECENVKVYNMSGQCVYNGTETTIPVATKGMYIVKVNNTTHKVIL
ncbi:MAG: leucine-rich repeat domain-containing protein [Muribaculaceae bacterium]|nr:leucine-rich repeat domain-containing protein [Muribaculaceae bacterium]